MNKLFANLDKLKNSPTPTILKSKELVGQGTSPTIQTNFGDQISLENRLKQVNFKTTRHLAQYFLSDVYTDYIKIIKPKVLEKVSPILITLPSTSKAQGGTTPTIIRFIPEQGGTTIIVRNYDSLLRQGVSLSNGVYKSFVVPKLSSEVDSLLASSKNYITVIPAKTNINQGIPVTPTIPIANLITDPGIVIQLPATNYMVFPQIQINQPAASYLSYPNIVLDSFGVAIQEVPAGIVITNFNSTDPNIKNKTAVLKTLGYTADRSLAFFAPEIKHGSEDPQNQGKETFNGDNPFVAGVALDSAQKTELITQALLAGASDVQKINTILQDPYISTLPRLKLSERPYYKSKGSNEKGHTYTTILSYKDVGDVKPAPSDSAVDEVVITLTRISDQKKPTVSFTALLKNLSDSYNVGTADVKFIGKQDTLKLYTGTTRQLSIGFMAVALGKGESRLETSAIDAKELATRINKLIQICAIGQVTNGAYTVGPMVKVSMQTKKNNKLTNTGLYKNLVAVVNSVKYDIATDDGSWDIDNMLPMSYNVSLDFNILSAADGKLFDSNKTFVG